MTMKRKVFSVLLALVMLCLCGTAMAAAPIIDGADLFTPLEEAELLELIEAFRDETGMDFAIITADQEHNRDIQDIADDLYDRGGYGLGENNSGILYYIDMHLRTPYLCTTGDMIDYMTDERIDAAHEASYRYLANGSYADAAEKMVGSVLSYVKRGIPEGQFRYDIITGERLTASHKALTPMEVLVCAGIAAVAALAMIGITKGSYAVGGARYEYNYRQNADVTLTEKTDDYLRTTTTRTRKAEPRSSSGGGGGFSGGSGVHRGGSGVSHGGGAGRKF